MNVLGMDIGGTAIKGAVITETMDKLDQLEIKVKSSDGREQILSSLCLMINKLTEKHAADAIGIGTAGRVNPETGEVLYATDNLKGWQGINLKREIGTRYHVPVFVENDANAALMGELWKRANYVENTVVMLTLGTGVGGANCINGMLVHGHHFHSGEWGHTILVPGGIKCNCGLNGCVEQYLSGNALIRMARQNGLTAVSHGKQVFELYSEGVREAEQTVEEYLENLSVFLVTISNGLDPDLVIIGGGVAESSKMFWGLLEEKLKRYKIPLRIKPAELGNEAGIYGAARLALDSVRKEGVR
ncbi:glucokinase [Melghiribacillus thermohalophilus]|uniref:Glucokinase n=1 Tax=Melghiribacillus thermohalophilus TaxID=1324956 RepID=A0A4R3N3U7_9BACI|nr:ROK family protein [Melghiribacillus thermohalophilus]TCT21753.1 glucokinase [Melghiribacillus thermohalophilus]